MPLTHFDAEGKARMVDVTEKKETVREATATGKIKVSRDVYDAIEAGTVGKGDVLSVATTAGIMGDETDGGSDSDVSYPADHEL